MPRGPVVTGHYYYIMTNFDIYATLERTLVQTKSQRHQDSSESEDEYIPHQPSNIKHQQQQRTMAVTMVEEIEQKFQPLYQPQLIPPKTQLQPQPLQSLKNDTNCQSLPIQPGPVVFSEIQPQEHSQNNQQQPLSIPPQRSSAEQPATIDHPCKLLCLLI